MHRITDVRVGGNARKNLAVFRKLCGEKFLPNVVLVTTMWSRGIERKYEPREKQLGEHEHLFRPFLEQGVPLLRHYNTEDGANEILGRIVNKSPRPMRIQEELVDEKKALGNTEAAQYLDNEYRERVENHRKELEALREDLKEALLNNESGTENELQKERECLEEQIKKMIDEADHFSSQYAEERQRRGRSESTPSSGTQKNTLLAGRRADAHLQGELGWCFRIVDETLTAFFLLQVQSKTIRPVVNLLQMDQYVAQTPHVVEGTRATDTTQSPRMGGRIRTPMPSCWENSLSMMVHGASGSFVNSLLCFRTSCHTGFYVSFQGHGNE